LINRLGLFSQTEAEGQAEAPVLHSFSELDDLFDPRFNRPDLLISLITIPIAARFLYRGLSGELVNIPMGSILVKTLTGQLLQVGSGT
jgi:hypothetical protein